MKNKNFKSILLICFFSSCILLFITFIAKSQTLTWVRKAPLNTGRTHHGIVDHNGKIYVVGGATRSGWDNSLEIYDPFTNNWFYGAPMPTKRHALHFAEVNGKLYAFGGEGPYGGRWAPEVEVYDPLNDSWSRKNNWPVPRKHCGIVVLDGKIYVAGGRSGYGATKNTFEVYDPVSDTWTTKIPMPQHLFRPAAAMVDGKIYIIGGVSVAYESDPGELLNIVQEYDLVSDSWTFRAPMPTKRQYAFAAVFNNKIYVIGGRTFGDILVDIVEEYDPTTDSWRQIESIGLTLRSRLGCRVPVLSNKIYVIGGDAPEENITTIVEAGIFNHSPTVVADIDPVMVDEGETSTNTGTVSDPDNDPVTLAASVGTVTNNGDGTWSWNFPTSDGPAESQTVTITADDGNGGTAETTFELIVNNVAPTVEAVTVSIDPVDINNQPVSASATFSDPAGTNDKPYTCTFDYGDGTDPNAGTVDGTTCTDPDGHTYETPGVYTVSVTVTDKDGASGSSEAIDYIIIYDPEGGFVTGGGWIMSPPGADSDHPDATGKANFGFVSKYKKGASVPTGNTEFQFKAGDLNFHSDSYEWLVIANAKAMYKGDGIINGSGNNSFQLSAIDADVNQNDAFDTDRFRIRIWDDSGLRYDNQVGENDPNADPTTEIGGGNIKIHKGGNQKPAAPDSEGELASEPIPENYALEQNYPNPFNPTTEITYVLPKDSHVDFMIFNLSGQLVRILDAGQRSAGIHTVQWDATDDDGNRVASGVYLAVLKADNFVAQQKIVFMK